MNYRNVLPLRRDPPPLVPVATLAIPRARSAGRGLIARRVADCVLCRCDAAVVYSALLYSAAAQSVQPHWRSGYRRRNRSGKMSMANPGGRLEPRPAAALSSRAPRLSWENRVTYQARQHA